MSNILSPKTAKEILAGDGEAFVRARQVINQWLDDPIDPDDPDDPRPGARPNVGTPRLLLGTWLSTHRISGYSTLDYDHVLTVLDAIDGMQKYLRDQTRQRPLNCLVLAAPGSGKSHLVSCLGKSLADSVSLHEFNMASMRSPEDMIPFVDRARNEALKARTPLLFLDEFDSDPANYALLLPLMWDGRLNLGQRELSLGKAIIILAGSNPALPGVIEHAKSMRYGELRGTEELPKKLVDLVSRINGGHIRVPALGESIDQRADKVVMALVLIRNRYDSEVKVPAGLLKFIAESTFRYDVRSLRHFIELLPATPDELGNLKDRMQLHDAKLLTAPGNSLAFHLIHEHGAEGIAKSWRKWMDGDQKLVAVWHRALDKPHELALKDDPCEEFKEQLRPMPSIEDEIAKISRTRVFRRLGIVARPASSGKDKPTTVLIVVDAQYDFLEGGALAVPDATAVVQDIEELVANVKENPNVKLVFTQDWHPMNHGSFKTNGGLFKPHCIRDTYGAQLWRPFAELSKDPKVAIIRIGTEPHRDGYSPYENPQMDQVIDESITRIFVVGLALEYCVQATCLDSVVRGHEVFTACDYVGDAASSKEKNAVWETLRTQGVKVLSKNEFTDALVPPPLR